MSPPSFMHSMSGTSSTELARRASGGLEITLYWSARAGSTSIEVWHRATDETLTFAVPSEQALDAFYHPFAYLPAAVEGHSPTPKRPQAGQTRTAA